MSSLSDSAFYLSKDLEINIRGRYLRFSASVEGLITKCIIYLNEVKTKLTGDEEVLDFKYFHFGKKEGKFKELLEFVYNDLYQANNELFEHLTNFREMRNKMAHCYFTWEETDLSKVIIWDLEDKKSKPHKVVPVSYSIQEINNSLDRAIKDITDKMNSLANEIIIRVKPEIPYMFD
jgi:hypothetical protein